MLWNESQTRKFGMNFKWSSNQNVFSTAPKSHSWTHCEEKTEIQLKQVWGLKISTLNALTPTEQETTEWCSFHWLLFQYQIFGTSWKLAPTWPNVLTGKARNTVRFMRYHNKLTNINIKQCGGTGTNCISSKRRCLTKCLMSLLLLSSPDHS